MAMKWWKWWEDMGRYEKIKYRGTLFQKKTLEKDVDFLSSLWKNIGEKQVDRLRKAWENYQNCYKY